MNVDGKARRVRIYVTEGECVGNVPSSQAILEFLQQENSEGTAVIRKLEDRVMTGPPGESHLAALVEQLPAVIEWTDSANRVERLLGRIKEMNGMVTVEDTDVSLNSLQPVPRVSKHVAVAEVMSRDLAVVAEEAPIRGVVERMLGKIYRAVPVVRDGVPVGIITNSDLVLRARLGVRLELLPSLAAPDLQEQLDRLTAGAKTAGQIMTPAPVSVHASALLSEVAATMARKVLKRLPVVDDAGQILGIISRLDLLRTVALGPLPDGGAPRKVGLNPDMPISQIMRRHVPTVFPETPVAEVLQVVASTRLNRAVVIDEERHVVGLVTDAETLERVAPVLRPTAMRSLMRRLPFVHTDAAEETAESHSRAQTARDLMRVDVPTAPEDRSIREAIEPMLRGKEKLIAVVDKEGRLTGIVDRADILRGLVGLGH